MGGGGGGGRVRHGATPNDTVQDGNAPAKTVSGHSGWRGWVHLGLGALEFVPIPLVSGTAGAIDAGMYIQEGSYGDAAAAGLSAIPGEKFFAVIGKGIKYFKDAREAKAAVKEAEEAKRLEKEAKDGESVARKKEEEQNGCKSCSKKPVILHSGAKVVHDLDFSLPGILPVELTRSYASNMNWNGPLGRNRSSRLDATLEKQADGTLLYRMGTDRTAVFDRPAPNPGVTSRGKGFPSLLLSAGRRGGYHLKEDALLKHFVRFKDGICRLAEIRDLNDNTIVFHREAEGLLTRVERSDGFAFLFENDGQGRRTAVTLRAPTGETRLVTRYSYDASGNLVEARNSYAKSRRYEYDEANRFLAYDDGVNERCEYVWDDADRVVAVRTPGGRFDHTIVYQPDQRATTLAYTARPDAATRYTFDEHGMTLTETNRLGHVRRYERNSKGTLLAEIDGEGHRTAYSYDAFGNVRTVTDAEGQRTTHYYNADGRLERLIDAAGNVWSWEYDTRGNLVASRDPLGYRADITNDAAGRPTATMRHDGLIEQRVYDAQHRLTRVVDYRGGVTSFERDAFGRVVTAIDPMRHVTRYAYDETFGAHFWTPSSVTRADGVELSRRVRADRATVSVTDGENRRTIFRYGPFELLAEIEDPKGGKLRFDYDHAERLVGVANQHGRRWIFERDLCGRVVRETDFDGLAIDYAYERSDRPKTVTHADKTQIINGYDGVGRLIREEVWEHAAQASKVTTFDYDAVGRIRSARNEVALVTFERDALGRVLAESVNGRRVESTFDCCGNRVERRLGGVTVKQAFDALGAVREIVIDGHSPLAFTRDSLGRELRRESGLGLDLRQRYDTVGQLIGQIAGMGAAPSIRRSYAWNAAFEPTKIDDARWGGATYVYDENGQIGEGRHGDGLAERFDYDIALSISASSSHAPAALTRASSGENTLAPWETSTASRVTMARGPFAERIFCTYDPRGQMIERRIERAGFRPVAWHYSWDGRGQLVACETPWGQRWAYGYDPFGRRMWKRRISTDRPERGLDGRDMAALPVGTWYGWDGDLPSEEAPLDPDGRPDWSRAVRWHFEPGSFVPLAREDPDGKILYVVADHLGTPREMLDESGKLVWAAEYSVWGAMRRFWVAANDNDPSPQGSLGYTIGSLALALLPAEAQADGRTAAQQCPIRFQGQWADEETGLSYNRYRHYDTLTAQYISPDPIGIVGGSQTRGYALNPLLEVDPLGLGGGSTTLRNNLISGGCVPSGVGGAPWQAQHIIPQQTWNENQQFFNDIGMGDQRDAAANGKALPRDEADGIAQGSCCHRGSHPNYTKQVDSQVAQIRNQFNNGQIDAAQARSQIGNLQQSLSQQMSAMPPGCRIS